jgi:hypothetical protein
MEEECMSRFVNRRVDNTEPVVFGVFESKFDVNGKFTYAMTKTPSGEYKFHRSIKSLFKELTSIPDITWYFHKDAQTDFDFAYLAYQMVEWAEKHGHTINHRSSGETILGMILRKPTVTFTYKVGKRGGQIIDKRSTHVEKIIIRNSQPMISLDLNEAVRIFAPHITIPGDLVAKPNPKNKNHMEHLQRRLDGMEAAIKGHDKLIYQTWGVHPGWTASGTARKAWRSGIPKGTWYWRIHKSKEDFIHKGYYAAFLYPGTTIDPHYDTTDIDEGGAYADCMRLGVPYGHPTWTREFKINNPGFYELYAESPGTNWPLLPFRDDRGWPHWTNESCHTYLSDIEIKWYSKRGWKFYITKGVYFDRIVYPFTEFIDKCESLEYPGGKPSDPAVKASVKPMRTRLYGSLALKSDQEMVIFKDPTNAELNLMKNNGYTPLINTVTGEQLPAWVVTKKVDADYINTHWAAYITAHQRLKLFDAMEQVGLKHVHYADTDSIKGDRDAIMRVLPTLGHKHGYGSWSIKAEYDWFQVDAPKAIHGKYTDNWAESQGMETSFFGMEAGVPKNVLALHPEYYSDNVPLKFNTVTSLKHALQYPDDPIIAERERVSSPFIRNTAWMVVKTANHYTIIPRPIHDHHPAIYGSPAVISAKHAIKWLRELGVNKYDIANKFGISMKAVENIIYGEYPGSKYLDQLISMIEQLIKVNIKVSSVS